MSAARDAVDDALRKGTGTLASLLDELEADAFRRGWEARDTEPQHLHRVVRRPDGTDGACCQPGHQMTIPNALPSERPDPVGPVGEPVTILDDQGGRERIHLPGDARPYDARGCRDGCRVHQHDEPAVSTPCHGCGHSRYSHLWGPLETAKAGPCMARDSLRGDDLCPCHAWTSKPEPLQVDTPIFDEPEQPGLERFRARLLRTLRGES